VALSLPDIVRAVVLGEAVVHASIAVFVADESGSHIAVNDRACELLGYGRDELLGRTVQDIVPGAQELERYRELVERGELAGTGKMRRRDGRVLDVDFVSCSTRIGNETVYVGFVTPSRTPERASPPVLARS
jgi:PAS domain S-box-containing protein